MKLICFLIIVFFSVAFAQNEGIKNDGQFPGHSIDLRISFWNKSQSTVSVGYQGVRVETGTGGISGRIMYNYYPNRIYSFNVSVGVMSNEVRVENLSNYVSTVAPVMMGMKYYFMNLPESSTFRPYLMGAIGGLFGTESATGLIGVRTHTETAVGAAAAIGSDIILGSFLKLHADLGYNLFTDFAEEIGSTKNYSGPEFSMGIGFMF